MKSLLKRIQFAKDCGSRFTCSTRKKDLSMEHVVLNLAAKTWKKGTFVSNTVEENTGISAVGDPVLKVHFVDHDDVTKITEAYYTEGTWTTRKLLLAS
jgi:hypothetical protein